MLFVIENKQGTKLIVQSKEDDKRSETERLLCIKMAVDHELKTSRDDSPLGVGFVDLVNLAYALHRNGFEPQAFREIKLS